MTFQRKAPAPTAGARARLIRVGQCSSVGHCFFYQEALGALTHEDSGRPINPPLRPRLHSRPVSRLRKHFHPITIEENCVLDQEIPDGRSPGENLRSLDFLQRIEKFGPTRALISDQTAGIVAEPFIGVADLCIVRAGPIHY